MLIPSFDTEQWLFKLLTLGEAGGKDMWGFLCTAFATFVLSLKSNFIHTQI